MQDIMITSDYQQPIYTPNEKQPYCKILRLPQITNSQSTLLMSATILQDIMITSDYQQPIYTPNERNHSAKYYDYLRLPTANLQSETNLLTSNTMTRPVMTPINVILNNPTVVELTRSSGAEILLRLTLDKSSALTVRWAISWSSAFLSSSPESVTFVSGKWM